SIVCDCFFFLSRKSERYCKTAGWLFLSSKRNAAPRTGTTGWYTTKNNGTSLFPQLDLKGRGDRRLLIP
ncbi:hypothetical protein JMJ77_0013182, partial [Colletotrichum scovillei]